MEAKYVRNTKEEEIEETEEKTWSLFNSCDEISATGVISNGVYTIEAYYEDEYLYKVCTQSLKELGFEEVNMKEKEPKNHYGDGTCYYNGVFDCTGCGECND